MANNFEISTGAFYEVETAGADRFSIVGGAQDAIPPTTNSFSPAVASVVGPTDFIAFTTTDNAALLRSLVLVSYPDRSYHVVHDGDAFSAAFAGLSTRTAVTGGYAFSVRPNNGWAAAPTLRIISTDLSGNETA